MLRRCLGLSCPSFFSSSSTRSWSAIESQCIRALQSVIHPETHRDVVYTGLIQKIEPRPDGSVLVHLDLDQHYRDLRPPIIAALKSVAGVHHVEIRMARASGSNRPSSAQQSEGAVAKRGGLADVDRILSVSSCKGGVGKSTVALNLAYALAQEAGVRVGLLDADLFGPSLPALIGQPNQRLYRDEAGRVLPLSHGGVQCLSYGFLAPDPQAATVARGPVISRIIQQLVLGTAWGQLDYLIVDMPPGTGDIPLSLMQTVSLNANVVVTTPQMLSRVDVLKGLAMFRKLAVPTIAAVHNMAYFVCDQCNTRHHPFGQRTPEFLKEFEVPMHIDLPIQKQIGDDADRGLPTMLSDDPVTEPIRSVMRSFALSVHDQIRSLRDTSASPPTVTIVANGDISFSDHGHSGVIQADRLRQRCRCAACLLTASSQTRRHRAIGMRPIGNYGIEIDWDDGHKGSIYPFEVLRELSRSEDNRQSDANRI